MKKCILGSLLAFKEKVASLEAGSRITPKEIQNSSNGTPRLVLEDGNFVTANKDFITLIKTKDSEKYITETPNEVKIPCFRELSRYYVSSFYNKNLL